MPATYQGNPTKFSSATVWEGSNYYSQGNLVTPSATPTGQVFVCIVSGESGVTEPSWSTPPLPTIGTTFVDYGATWQMLGSQPGPWVTAVQLPVDADPPLAFAQVIPDSTLADQTSWLTLNAGILGANNTWTGSNTWNGTSLFNGTAEFANTVLFDDSVNFDAGVNLYDGFRVYTGSAIFDTFTIFNNSIVINNNTSSIEWSAYPTSGNRNEIMIAALGDGGNLNGRFYADFDVIGGGSMALTLTTNAYYYGGSWGSDDSGYASMYYEFGQGQFSIGFQAPTGSTWGNNFGGGGWAEIFSANGTGVTSWVDFYAQGDVNITGILNGENANLGPTVVGNLTVDNNVLSINGQTTQGQFGVPVVAQVIGQFNVPSPGNYAGPYNVTGGSLYEFKCFINGNASGSLTSGNFQFGLQLTTDFPSGINVQNSGGYAMTNWNDSTNQYGAISVIFCPTVDQQVNFVFNVNSGTINVLNAVLVQFC
jgi:hypothetical protein